MARAVDNTVVVVEVVVAAAALDVTATGTPTVATGLVVLLATADWTAFSTEVLMSTLAMS